MIIGTGQLAKAFDNANFDDNVCIFASGVSDSNCKDNAPFEREKNLLREALKNNVEKKFIYFSSCASMSMIWFESLQNQKTHL